eukprot:g12054.t1
MDKIIPHEELLAGGELTIFQKSLGKAAFVSHQWVGKGHPDPEFKQMQVLQDALQNLISGTSEVNVDMVTESVYFRSKGIPASEWQEQNLYLWYDYFSCPQAAHVSEQGLQKAISSIPSYVSRSDFFIALCPVLSNPGETETFSEHSWAYRGWCRELRAAPLNLSNCSPGEGMFTVESDRERIGVVLAKLVKGKLLFCLENMELPHYRFLLNQQTSILRGLPVKPIEDVVHGFEGEDVLERFMYQNGFQNPFDYDSAGWSPMCYACMKGDVSLVAALLKQRVDPNEKIKKARAEINLDKGCSLIHICARFRNHEAMQVLFAANAAVNVQGIPHSPVGVAAMENDPIGIRLLCSVSADPRKKNLGGTAVLVRRLIEAGADVDEPYLTSNLIRMLLAVKGLQYTWGRDTIMRRVSYHSRRATPLMIAILCGNFEVASCLLVQGANVNLRNARGKSAKDLANELRAPDYLLQAMGGAIEKCISIASPDSPSSTLRMAPSMLVGHPEEGDALALVKKEYFGSLEASMLTLFQLMAFPNMDRPPRCRDRRTDPRFENSFQPVFSENPSLKIFFVIFVIFGAFMMASILTGVITEGMIEKSRQRQETTPRMDTLDKDEERGPELKDGAEIKLADGGRWRIAALGIVQLPLLLMAIMWLTIQSVLLAITGLWLQLGLALALIVVVLVLAWPLRSLAWIDFCKGAYRHLTDPVMKLRVKIYTIVFSLLPFGLIMPIFGPWERVQKWVRWHPYNLDAELLWRGTFATFALAFFLTAANPKVNNSIVAFFAAHGVCHSVSMFIDNRIFPMDGNDNEHSSEDSAFIEKSQFESCKEKVLAMCETDCMHLRDQDLNAIFDLVDYEDSNIVEIEETERRSILELKRSFARGLNAVAQQVSALDTRLQMMDARLQQVLAKPKSDANVVH